MRKKPSKFRLGLILIGLIILVGGFYFLNFWWNINQPAQSEVREVYFEIKDGQGVNEISLGLSQASLINSNWDFELYIWLIKSEGKLQAGAYDLNTAMSIREITKAFISGEALSKERSITVIEGWRSDQIADYLEAEGVVRSKEFLQLVQDPPQEFFADYPFLRKNKSLEGFLFPETYRIFKETTAESIIRKMLAEFDRRTAELRKAERPQEMTFYEALTLASIVEREVDTVKDRAMAADVFLKRLEIGMPLQSDATVNYVTGKKTTRPTYDDLDVESSYNTYQHKGLPPGPISNPSLSSIKGVLEPIANDYFYFLTTDKGRVIYGKTGENHNYNRAKYLK